MGELVHPDLGGEEDVAAGYTGAGNRLADLRLVAVDLRGVNVPEAEFDCLRQNAQHVVSRHAEGAEAEGGNMGAIGADIVHEVSLQRGREG